jgi:hypothetical protein
MAGRGPAPKPAHLRARTNRKPGAALLEARARTRNNVPPIPNPDRRAWHPLTVSSWNHAWSSPMATQWLDTDADALGRLALLWDAFYREPDAKVLAEIRLQESRFGLSPLDRSRLQWEIQRTEERETTTKTQPKRPASGDPRRLLMAVK